MRQTEVYISYEVKSLLHAIAKSRNLTADLVADGLLKEIIYANYPQAREIVDKMADLKQEMIESFRNGPDNNSESSTLQNLEAQGRLEAPRTKT